MACPSTSPDYHSPKRLRFSSDDEDEYDEDENYNAASDEGEAYLFAPASDDSRSASVQEEEIIEEEEEVQIAENVCGMATVGSDFEIMVTDAQSGRSVCNSIRSSSSSQQSLNLKSSDVLDCPTCCEPLKRPIYQCTNGHVACSSCCTKLRNKCPSCRSHIGDIRCRAMERVIEATIVPCRNEIYGCKQTTAYGNQPSHEKLCFFTPCYCPLPNCDYKGSYTDLKSHARVKHLPADWWGEDKLTPLVLDSPLIFGLNPDKNMMAFFQEEKEGDLIVVQAFKGSHGVYVTVNCIAPMAPEIRNLSCSLAKLKEFATLKQGLQVKKIRKLSEPEEPEDGFMLIPNYMLGDGNLKMQFCIGSEYKYIHI